MRGVTDNNTRSYDLDGISIHTPHAGSDTDARNIHQLISISIHTPHAGSDDPLASSSPRFHISIHTPHAGSDCSGTGKRKRSAISIHTPHAGSDQIALQGIDKITVFQSTLPMRGVTVTRMMDMCFLR